MQRTHQNEHSRTQAAGNVKGSAQKQEQHTTKKGKHKPEVSSANVQRKGAMISLESVALQGTWEGREPSKGKPRIVSIPFMLRRCRNLEQSAEATDPWAVETYQIIKADIRQSLEQLAEMESVLDSAEAAEHSKIALQTKETEFHSKCYEMEHRSDLGWALIDLTVRSDDLACDLLEARDEGRIDATRARDLIRQLTRNIRRVGSLIAKWKYTGVTATDVADDNQLARDAAAKMKWLPKTKPREQEATLRDWFKQLINKVA